MTDHLVEPKIVDRDEFAVLGVLVENLNPEELGGFEEVWGERFMTYHEQITRYSTDKAYYGVTFATEGGKNINYLAGMAVAGVDEPPQGLVLRRIPAAREAVFQATVATIHKAYHLIFGEWLPSSGYDLDVSMPGFEKYPPGTSGLESPVSIHVPVREKR
jgi:predicted transcriptional regulator YdeE